MGVYNYGVNVMDAMTNRFKEVYFDKYCKDCKNKKKSEYEDPCFDCISRPVNEFSHKPVNFIAKEAKK